MAKFRELEVWKRAMKYTTRVYEVSAAFPKSEVFGLTGQLRRAAVSIALNIAEGSGSGSDAEFSRFLQIALRSSYEVVAAIDIALNLGYLTRRIADELTKEADEIAAMLGGLIRYLGKKRRQTPGGSRQTEG